ncbi:nucleotidyl transferase AbiEii/AbiGii toxin family protein [Pediococcus ethanolidurans]|uniref:nucleotidyl transferase AbiEii/AbiGii toxin family protein n=1 Tax=Pediococcus ethanolidurans TaxID=319653 RepID=UPI001C1F0A80|nr:nucleotidyl transferase AbiEii/AbiGii toxin family protein [Pediococcus ethanolidurans]MBU7563817.1 nucleotidyl transferase AbiEii/AbiGii toxin family protein [Pediococcus ethanolidurans]MCV3315229.1 nucleotidyl transferase AbiEii/AbiGii toxin family protein [Pediococcus ethanolidurans]MCV3327254.1 nucleotidyl transferase AbiEii/AbiGii toxin family protein [Pediococcus ethanolidurans]
MSEVDKVLPMISKRARKLGYNIQHFQKLFFLEHFLKQISESNYRRYFVLKGGFEIQSLVGIENRMTQDLDAIYIGPALQPDKLATVLNEVFEQSTDYVNFTIKSIEQKQLDDDYPGIRVNLLAQMGKSKVSVKLDISKGNPYETIPIMLDHQSILNAAETFPIYGIPVEKILADKLSAFLNHGMLNTRAKDLFDVYSLSILYRTDIDLVLLKKEFFKSAAFDHIPNKTIENRLTEISTLSDSESLKTSWQQYQQQYDYAQSIGYTTALEALFNLMKEIEN